jgi:hypothetical protein
MKIHILLRQNVIRDLYLWNKRVITLSGKLIMFLNFHNSYRNLPLETYAFKFSVLDGSWRDTVVLYVE